VVVCGSNEAKITILVPFPPHQPPSAIISTVCSSLSEFLSRATFRRPWCWRNVRRINELLEPTYAHLRHSYMYPNRTCVAVLSFDEVSMVFHRVHATSLYAGNVSSDLFPLYLYFCTILVTLMWFLTSLSFLFSFLCLIATAVIFLPHFPPLFAEIRRRAMFSRVAFCLLYLFCRPSSGLLSTIAYTLSVLSEYCFGWLLCWFIWAISCPRLEVERKAQDSRHDVPYRRSLTCSLQLSLFSLSSLPACLLSS